VKAGDRISMAGVEVRLVTSVGETIKTPLAGAGQPLDLLTAWQDGTYTVTNPRINFSKT
jgi:hypothetical protein